MTSPTSSPSVASATFAATSGSVRSCTTEPDLDPMALAHAVGDLFQQRPIPRDENEIQSALRQFVGQAGADAFGCARDDGPAPVLLREVLRHDGGPHRRPR